MALRTAYLPGIDGLQTETSNINSDPRSLVDCIDVISNRDDFLESRHGHPVCKLVNEGRVSSFNDHTALGMYDFRNSTQKVYISTYRQTSGLRFLWVSQTTEEISASSDQASENITVYPITRAAQVNVNPVVFSHDQRLFFMTDNGIFFKRNTYEVNPIVYKTTFPVIRTISINPEFRPTANYTSVQDAENSHWLVPGYQVNVKLIIEVETKFNTDGSRRVESPTTRIYEIRRINPSNTDTFQRTSNMLVTISDLTISSLAQGTYGALPSGQYQMFLKIYRTKQFKIGESAETEYYLAHPEIQINSTTIVDSANPSTYIRLTANDDFVTYLEHLYNDTSLGGIGVTNHLPVPSKSVTPFRNYYIYSNLSLPALTTIGLTKLPDPEDVLRVKLARSDGVSDRNHTINFTSSLTPASGEVTIPSNAQSLSSPYLATENDLSFRGLRPGLGDVSSSINARVRITPGTSQGQIEPYGKITQMQFIRGASGSQNTTTVRVYPDTTGFDSNRFKSPGIAAIVDSTGRIRSLFNYDNVQKNTAVTNYIDFVYAVTEASASSDLTATLYVYYIPGEQIKGLPLYIGDSSRYLSLLPCKNQFQEDIAIPQITATLAYEYKQLATSLTGVTYSTTLTTVTLNFSSAHGLFSGESYLVASGNAAVDGTFVITVSSPTVITYSKVGAAGGGVLSGGSITPTLNDLTVNPFYSGRLNKPFSLLLNDLAKGICDELNRQANSLNEYLFCRGGDLDQPGVIILESLNADYEVISLSKGSSYTTNKRVLSSYSITSNEVTITTVTAHPYVTGDLVTVESTVPAINGEYAITKLGTFTFKYSKTLTGIGTTAISGNSDKAQQCYEPPVPTNPNAGSTFYTVFAKAERAGNAFIVSKLNLPEVVPTSDSSIDKNVSGPYYPTRIGSPNKAIVACAATRDSIYMLKEDGVARITLGVNSPIPIIDTINMFDTTVFCIAAGSVQTINDAVFLLAQDGVYAIEGNSISKLSRPIETELKVIISKCKNASLLESVRSFANPAKNLYGVCVPISATGYVTYVLNTRTMRWCKWSNQFNGSAVDLDGRLTTLCTSNEQSATANYIRQDTYTNSDPRNEADQLDENYLLFSTTSVTSGLERTLTRAGTFFYEGLGDLIYRMRYFSYSSNQFNTKQVYYYDGTTLHKLASVQRMNSSDLKLVFTSTPPAFSTAHRLIVGVNMMLEFKPFSAGNPSTLKQFTGFHTHTEQSVSDLGVQFKSEATAYTNVKMVSTSPSERTVYRCFIPTSATRGRFIYRRVTHTKPYEICAIPAQAIIFRDTGSERVQKEQ